MTIRSWLVTCSSLSCTENAPENQAPSSSPKLLDSDTSSSSTASHEQESSSTTTCSSNLSLQTLPSLLTTLENLSVSHSLVSSLKAYHSITCLAVSETLLYAASGYEVNVFDVTNNYAHVDAFKDSGSGSVKSVTFSNGKVFTGHQDCRIRVWQISNSTKRHQLVATLPTVKDRLRRFVLPKNYVSVRRHKKRLWIENADTVSGLAVSGVLVYSVSWDKCLKMWRSKDLRCLESVKAHEDAINAVAVNSVDGTVYTGSADARIKVWGKSLGEKRHGLVATLEKHKSGVNALALSDDGSVLFSGACDRSILVWEREDSANHMAVTGALTAHAGAILCLSSVSDLLASGSADRTVRVWQRGGSDGRFCCLAVLEGHEKAVKSVVAVSGEVSEGVVSVCSGSLDGEIKAWRVVISKKKSSSSSDPNSQK